MNYVRLLSIGVAIACLTTFCFFILRSPQYIKIYNGIYTTTRTANDSSTPSSVTRIIHQSWKDNNVPPRFRNYSKSWTEFCLKDWKYMFWTDLDNLNLIKVHYPWFLQKYNKLPSAIHRADVLRYFYMLHFGGIYTDLDNECLRPFEHLLVNYTMVFGAMKGQYAGTSLKEGYVQNSFMYSVPHHPFWLEMIIAVLNSPVDSAPESQTGPVLLSKLLKGTIERNGKNDNIVIYAPDMFNPFSWLDRRDLNKHCKDFDRMSFEDWQICKSSMFKKGSFVVQYHAHSWG